MKKQIIFSGILVVLVAIGTSSAEVVIDWVTVGNPGNGPDERYGGYGAVDYTYRIGKYELTAGLYTEFLNAVAKTDTYGLYNPNMWSVDQGCKIQQSGSPGNYTYTVAAEYANRPVGDVSWGDAARFTNWLTNGQLVGDQDTSTTEDGSYYLNGAMSTAELIAVTRKTDAIYVLPTRDEWYKAAYHKNDGITANYWDYPTATNSVPSNSVIDPDPGNNANFSYGVGSPYWRNEVGEFENSLSAYGTFDQGGNVWEWDESIRSSHPLERGLMGGSFTRDSSRMWAGFYDDSDPTDEIYSFGFRVVQVPEPSTIIVLTLGSFFLLKRNRQ